MAAGRVPRPYAYRVVPIGGGHLTIPDIQGRRDDVFVYGRDFAVHPHVFRSVLARQAAVSEYQVRQTTRGAEILLRTHAPVDTTRIEDELQIALGCVRCPDPTVTIKLAEQLPRLDTGKLKRFVPLHDATITSNLGSSNTVRPNRCGSSLCRHETLIAEKPLACGMSASPASMR